MSPRLRARALSSPFPTEGGLLGRLGVGFNPANKIITLALGPNPIGSLLGSLLSVTEKETGEGDERQHFHLAIWWSVRLLQNIRNKIEGSRISVFLFCICLSQNIR